MTEATASLQNKRTSNERKNERANKSESDHHTAKKQKAADRRLQFSYMHATFRGYFPLLLYHACCVHFRFSMLGAGYDDGAMALFVTCVLCVFLRFRFTLNPAPQITREPARSPATRASTSTTRGHSGCIPKATVECAG